MNRSDPSNSEWAMLVSISLLFICAGLAIFFFRLTTQNKVAAMNSLAKRRKKLQEKYDYMLGKKWELKAELSQQTKELETLINNQDGIKIRTAAGISISEDEEEKKISTYLLASGKLSLESDHKIRRKMPILKMSYLSTGVTLGFIDLETSEKLKKGDWTIPR